jgi:hypothetical protein
VARLLLLALSPLAFDGCTSLGVVRTAGAGSGAAKLEVFVFADRSARDGDVPIDHPVFTHLFRVEGAREVSVARSLAARWTLEDLPPGRYRLEATKEIDARGDIRDLPSRGSTSFALAAGETARVEVLRKQVPVVLIILAAVTVVLLAILAIHLADDAHLPHPPVPPLPPFPVAVAVDLSFALARDRGPQPGVADVFPAPGSVVAARRVAVSFLLVAPLAQTPAPEAVIALGSTSGEIDGAITYLPREQLLRFLPERDFAPGETVTVTLDLSRLRGEAGASGEGRVSTSFTVPKR